MTTLQIYINPKLRKESSSTDENKSKFLTDDHGERVRGFVKIILAGAINQISGTQHTSVTKKKTSRKNKKKRKDFFQIFVKMKMRRATFEAEMQNGCEVESTSGERKEETVIRIHHHLLCHNHHNDDDDDWSSVMTMYQNIKIIIIIVVVVTPMMTRTGIRMLNGRRLELSGRIKI